MAMLFARAWLPALLCALSFVRPVAAMDLMEMYEVAVVNNEDILVARDAALATAEAVPQARAALLPSIGIQVSRSMVHQKRTVRGTKFPSEKYDLESDAIQLLQPVFRPGLWTELRRARHMTSGAEAEIDLARRQVAMRMVEAFLQQAWSEERRQRVAEEIKRREVEINGAHAAIAAGTGTRVTVDEAEADIARLHADYLTVQLACAQQLAALRAAVGQELPPVSPIDWTRVTPEEFSPLPLETLLAQAEKSYPLFNGLRAASAAARSALLTARANHLPTMDVIARLSTDSGSNPYFADNGVDQGSIGLQVQVPIFSGGELFSKDREAAARLSQQEDTYLKEKRDISLTMQQAHDAVTTGIAQVRALERAIRAANSSVESTNRGIVAGIRTTLDRIVVERQRYELELAQAEHRYAMLKAWFELQTLAGEDLREALRKLDATLEWRG